MPDPFKTDAILWYNNGVWGQLGYAVPNFALGAQTENSSIQELVAAMGRNLSAVMHDPDADLRTPPSINTIMRMCKLVVRARTLLVGRAVPPGTANMEGMHIQPGVQDQIIYPVPFFGVRNTWIKGYASLVLAALAEACQNTENRNAFEISTTFAGLIGQYLQRVYTRIGVELLQLPLSTFVTPATDAAPATPTGYTMEQSDFNKYNPGAWFTQTEMIDVTPPITQLPTDIDLQVLTNGVAAEDLVGLALWPSGQAYNPAAASAVDALGNVGGAAPAAGTISGALPSTPGSPGTNQAASGTAAPAATAPAAAVAFPSPPAP